MYTKLYHTTWRTNGIHDIQEDQPLQLRAFKGNYTINVRQGGQIVTSENFTLDLSGKVVEIHLNGSGKYILLTVWKTVSYCFPNFPKTKILRVANLNHVQT